MGFPMALVEGYWGCIQFTDCNLLSEILHKLMQFAIREVTKLCLEMTQSCPTGVGICQWVYGVPLLL